MIYLALVTGFVGSFHCFGMCGPLALAMPVPRKNRFWGMLLYNLGRTATYTALGLVFGLAGLTLKISGFQQSMSVFLGVVFLVAVFLPFIGRRFERQILGFKGIKWLKAQIVKQFKIKTLFSSFIVGTLNGLLPCGLVYFAIAGSLATGDLLEGSLYMIAFSLGTFPAMLSLTFVHRLVPANLKNKLTPALSLLLAAIFIYRGISLEIPQLSFALEQVGLGKITSCGN